MAAECSCNSLYGGKNANYGTRTGGKEAKYGTRNGPVWLGGCAGCHSVEITDVNTSLELAPAFLDPNLVGRECHSWPIFSLNCFEIQCRNFAPPFWRETNMLKLEWDHLFSFFFAVLTVGVVPPIFCSGGGEGNVFDQRVPSKSRKDCKKLLKTFFFRGARGKMRRCT